MLRLSLSIISASAGEGLKVNNNAKRSNEGWTVADAKARLSEILRLAHEEPQFIGANRTHVIVSADAWESLRERPAMGKWLVESLKGTGGLTLPDRAEPDREGFDDE